MVYMTKTVRMIVNLSICLVFAGCSGTGGKNQIPDLVPCQGTVTLDGNPLERGTIGFAPMEAGVGQSAAGQIKHGRFVMNTTVSSPGVVIGKYRVRVESSEEPDPDDQSKGPVPKPPKSLIPPKYNNPKTSGFEVTVTKGMPSVTLELTSK